MVTRSRSVPLGEATMNKASKRLVPSTAQGEERRHQLLDAARVLFGERGYAGTRISDICDAAGVSKGLVHWYFPNKETLFIEVLRGRGERMDAAIRDAIDPAADPLERLRRRAAAMIRFSAANRGFSIAIDARRGDRNVVEEVTKREALWTAGIHDLVVEAQQDGLVAPGDARMCAIAIMGTITAFVHALLRAQPNELDTEEVVDAVTTMVTRLCGANAPATA
jgi:AcrR family transcriptional regulator